MLYMGRVASVSRLPSIKYPVKPYFPRYSFLSQACSSLTVGTMQMFELAVQAHVFCQTVKIILT